MKISSFRLAEKDDPIFTGGFKVHSVRAKDPVQKKKKKDKIKYAEKKEKINSKR